LKLHGDKVCGAGKPTANCRRQLEIIGTEELILRGIERPSVREDERPVEFVLRKFFAEQLGSRNITYRDAVNLGTVDCTLRPSNDLDTGGVIAVLSGNGIEVVGYPVCALKANHYSEPSYDREFGTSASSR
jgi:hypothetical protein